MSSITINTAVKAFPMLYAYSTPQIAEHTGWTKIGYTEKQNVEERIKQQAHTVNVETKLEWKTSAIYDDGSGDQFTDKDFHAYLRKDGVENKPLTEWFKIDGPAGLTKCLLFRQNRGAFTSSGAVPYKLRKEQELAVAQTKSYWEANKEGEFLWNAKPRFGKTLSVYDFCKQIDAKKILIVTNRPAIANSWYKDYEKFVGCESGLIFVSDTDNLKGQRFCVTRQEYLDQYATRPTTKGFIEFVSLQDLKGSIYFGGKFNKLAFIKEIEWDILVIDEAHEGIDTFKTDAAFDRINRQFTLHLSGTPFKALANDKFEDNAIFNWTYADEQKAKASWSDSSTHNPYSDLPCLNLFTYQMSEIIEDKVERGIDINGENTEFAFDLNEFFETKNGRFVHDASVDRFLDALTTQEKFPFSTPELRNELKHTFWLLNRVDSAKALAKKLSEHPVFQHYEIVLAAGDGRIDDNDEAEKAYSKVENAIRDYEKTITLSVGQLTTGVTVPEWTAVLMLCNLKSPALYMQAAFRAQNPCLFRNGAEFYRKENAYVFDFDPARTLIIFEEFANDLSPETMGGRGDSEKRKENVRELLNFFPVIGEDEDGEMVALDAAKVLSIPRKLKSQEVVRRGFMCNYLFQNVSGIFGAPSEVIDILTKLDPVSEAKSKPIPVTQETATDLHINPETGEVEVPKDVVVGKATEVFGDKVYGPKQQEELKKEVEELVKTTKTSTEKTSDDLASTLEKLSNDRGRETIQRIVKTVDDEYKSTLKVSDKRALERSLTNRLTTETKKVIENYRIEEKVIEQTRLDALRNRDQNGKTTEVIEAEIAKQRDELQKKLASDITAAMHDFAEDSSKEVIEKVETRINQRRKSDIEESVRDHLRGFSRTIPSFLMAYGDNHVTLGNFDTIVPNSVFLDVTSITLDEFRFLRDGGTYVDAETGEQKEFAGRLFNPIVFDDSVQEFLRLKKKLADYFNEQNLEDIFDYVPAQKTNQIFTPKVTVQKMVDLLETENPGCFDDPNKTFIDLYMKSGLYITEIVKRLYRSPTMKTHFPDPKVRLRHIFEKQVYGLAPTEIIYEIAISYILGFDESHGIEKHNFRQFDATPYAEKGNLSEMLDDLFGKSK